MEVPAATLIVALDVEQERFLARWVRLFGILLVVACAVNALLHVLTQADGGVWHYVMGMITGTMAVWSASRGRASAGLVGILVVSAGIVGQVHITEQAGDTAAFYLLPLALLGALALSLRVSAVVTTALVVWILVVRSLRPFHDANALSHTVDMLVVLLMGVAVAMVVRRRHIQENERLRASIRELSEARVEQERLREQAEQAALRAEEANRTKSRFLANMSHELRTPLNAIIGYAELVAEDPTETSASQDLEHIQSAGHHLLGIVDDILDLARVESGGRQVQLETVSIDDLIAEVAEWSRPQLTQRHNRLLQTCAPGIEITTDRLMTRQILLNLLANAIHFTEHGTVTLRTHVLDDQLVVEVEDEGVGIEASKLESIFEAFVQVDHTRGGTGLGLTLVRRFVQGLGGEVSATSEPGVGSCFRVTLPLRGPRTTPEVPLG